MIRLLIVRHGGTEWSRQRRFAGWRDVPLTAHGLVRSEAVARALGPPVPVRAVYASPLLRARTCAEPVARAHGLEVRIAPDFKEMGFGAWEGLSRNEAETRFPEAFALWRAEPHRLVVPGAERLLDVAARVERGLASLRAAHDGDTVVLITHAIVARLVALQALGLRPERLWSMDASPGGITEIEYREDWVTVHRLNTRAHLEPVAALEAQAS